VNACHLHHLAFANLQDKLLSIYQKMTAADMNALQIIDADCLRDLAFGSRVMPSPL